MPEPVNWPPIRRPMHTSRPPEDSVPGRRWLWLIFAVFALVFLGGRTWLSYYVDALWFSSLHYEEVFWKTLSLEWGVFAAFGVVTFLILYGTFLLLKRTEFAGDPGGQTILIGGQAVKLPVDSILRLLALIGSLLIAAGTAAVMMAQWQVFALYWYAPSAAGAVDPIFGRPVSFYLFTLPAWQLVSGWLMVLAVVSCAIAAFFLLVNGGAMALEGYRNSYERVSWRGISITFSFLLLVIALQVYLGRFDRLSEDHTIFGGVTYTDAARDSSRAAGPLRGPGAGLGNRGGKRPLAEARPVADRGDCSGGPRLFRPADRRIVRRQLYRQAERTGSRDALHRAQHRVDAAGVRPAPDCRSAVSRRRRRSQAADPRRQRRPRCRTSGCGTGGHCRTRCGRCRKSGPITTFPTSTSTATTIDGTLRQVMLATRELNINKLPGEQPQLDQREADLHARLRHHHEPASTDSRRRGCRRCC